MEDWNEAHDRAGKDFETFCVVGQKANSLNPSILHASQNDAGTSKPK